MRRWFLAALIVAAITLATAGPAPAQRVDVAPAPIPAPVYDPPGYYGMAWGVPSFGVPRTHSNFASPFGGVGYGYGYDPYAVLPGSYGMDLWRPDRLDPVSSYARGSYSTFPIPRGAVTPPPGVPVGYYAPWLGPPMIVRP